MRVAQRNTVAAPLYAAILTLLILAPVLQPGYLLFRDAVSTPRSYLTDSALGLGDAAPRAVPQDWLLAGVSRFIDGGIAVKAILFLAVWLAGWGAAMLVRVVLRDHGAGVGSECAAVTLAIWNPYIAERLAQGHWSLFTGYAALPWIAVALHRVRRCQPAGWPLLITAIGCAALTPTGTVLAIVLTMGLLILGRPPRFVRLGLVVLAGAAASAPWVTAALLSGSPGISDSAGVDAFAARAEPLLGTLGSLAGLGGMWNSEAVPTTRTTPLALVGTGVLLMLVATGAAALIKWRRRDAVAHEVVPLGVIGLGSVLLPTLAATPWGLRALGAVASTVPGAGILRDTQKFVALAMPFYALCVAAAVIVIGASTQRSLARAVPITACALLVAVLPDLAWGVGGTLRTIEYPPGWQEVARTVGMGSPHGAVAVLPAGVFRIYPYTGDVVVLDPSPRLLPRDVLMAGDLIVGGNVVPGEGERGRHAEQALLAGADPETMLEMGVEWVLLQHNTPGPLGNSGDLLGEIDTAYADDDLTLYRIAGEPRDLSASAITRATAIAAHTLWLVLTLGGASALAATRLRGTSGVNRH